MPDPFTARARGLLALAVVAGLAGMIAGHAPRTFIAGNAGALILGLGLTLLPIPTETAFRRRVLALALLACLAIAVLGGPPVDGVRRWIAIGPVRLHAGMLAGPALAVILAAEPLRWRLAGFAAAMALALAAPDTGMALAWAGGWLASLRFRSWPRAMSATAVLAVLLAATAMRADPLQPVPFVESVVRASWNARPIAAIALALASGAPLLLALGADRLGRTLAGFWAGLLLASFIGPFPSPLIGYGAAPILGLGLAIAVRRGLHRDRAGLRVRVEISL